MENITLIAATQMGMESIVAQELTALGYTNVEVLNGKVKFKGTSKDIFKTNLWLRTADRILIEVGSFPATTFDELFEGTKALDWAEWIPANGEFPVQGRSHQSQLSSVPASQGIVKKAIVEKLKQNYNTDWFSEDGALYGIEVSLLKDQATITIDTTGPSLHKRGYRQKVTQAPLKETMAAALVLLSRWNADRPLYDPFCGSGTIAIEAAMIGWNIAPGLRRSFPFQKWDGLDRSGHKQVLEEALDAADYDQPLDIVGTDIDRKAIDTAKLAAKKAGFQGEIKFTDIPVSKIHPNGEYGCVITNPPYGERLSDENEARRLIATLGRVRKTLPTWSFFVLSPNEDFEPLFRAEADKRRKLYNGRIECQFLQYFGPLPPKQENNT